MREVPEGLRARLAGADSLRDSGRIDAALEEYCAIVTLAPDSAQAHFKLGTGYAMQSDRQEDAERCYRNALAIWRSYPEANHNLGFMLAARCEYDEGEERYLAALAERPDFAGVHHNLGRLLLETGRLDRARYHAHRVQSLRPDWGDGFDLLGQVARAEGKITEAIAMSRHAVSLAPDAAAVWTNLGTCLSSCGRHDEAEEALRRALEISPGYFPAWNNLLLSSNFRRRDREDVFALHRSYGCVVRERCGEPKKPTSRPDAERRLRVGILSGDLRHHSVAYFLRGPLEFLNRSQFQLFAYYNQRIEDDVMWKLKSLFHWWRSVHGIDDEATAELIRQDRIDILIDLAGHTATGRPLVLGRKPAPVQVHWIGYPNTTGLDSVDYRLTDEWTDPEAEEGRYSVEKPWRLPASFLCYAPPDTAPDVVEPPCLTRNRITFGSFNVRAKLSGECIDLWCEVLRALPDARLVLKSYFGAGDEDARAELRQMFVDRGIAAGRVDILEKRESTADYLAAYAEMDIALDTFPYNGTTTSCEALWMGVPVVTLTGDRHVARVGTSLLNNAGLPDLVAATADDFVAIAVELASNYERLRNFRLALRQHLQGTRLLDKVKMGGDLGAALRGMWREYCGGLPEGLPLETGSSGRSAELMKLHIGGREVRDGWKILDIEPRDEVDFAGDVTNLDAFADECCSEIYCSHVLEHVPQAQIAGAVAGFHRILAPGGHLYVSVPDLEVLSWLMLNPSYGEVDRFNIMRRMFGGQRDAHDFHMIGLYFDLMSSYLRNAGFSAVDHVQDFGLFNDASTTTFDGRRISLNLIATK